MQLIIKNEKNSHKVLNCKTFYFVLLLTVFLILRDIFNIAIPKTFFIAFCILPALVYSTEDMLSCLFFQLPLFCGLPGNYIVLAYFVILLVKQRTITRSKIFAISFCTLWEFVASIFYPRFDLVETVSYIIFVSLFFILINDEHWEINKRKCVYFYAIGIVVTSIIIVISTLQHAPSNWLSLFASGSYRFGNKIASESGRLSVKLNPNALSFYAITAIALTLALLENERSVAHRIFMWICTVFLLFTGLLTASRTFILVLFVLILLYGIRGKKISKKIQTILTTFIFVFVAFVIIDKYFPGILQAFVGRFEGSDFSSGNGRLEISQKYMETFYHSIRIMLIGAGAMQNTEVMGMSYSLHNSILQILVSYGIIGTTIFLLMWFMPIIKRFKRKIPFSFWIPMIVVLLYSLSAQMVNPPTLLFPHLLAAYCLDLSETSNSGVLNE